MKKKALCVCLALAVLAMSAALAEPGRIDDKLFDMAKQTMHCLDTGDYSTASALVGCADSDTLKNLVRQKFTSLGSGMAQTRISVAFVSGDVWYLAVPVSEPSSRDVEALVLCCDTGSCATQVGEASWGDVADKLDASGMVIWNEEYSSDVIVVGN